MNDLIKHEIVLVRVPEIHGPGVVFWGELADEADTVTEVKVPTYLWEEMGEPNTVTVAVEPGDRLNGAGVEQLQGRLVSAAQEALMILSSLARSFERQQISSPAMRLRLRECARALRQALAGEPVKRWVLTNPEEQVNAFVGESEAIPSPEEFEVGYSLGVDVGFPSVGAHQPRLRIEVAGG